VPRLSGPYPPTLRQGCTMKIRFAEFAPDRSCAVVVGVWEERVMTAPAARLDAASGGAITRALAAAPRFRGKKDELLPIIGPAKVAATRIILAGLGKPEALDARRVQDLGGNLAAHLNGSGESEAVLAIEPGDAAALGAAEIAAHLAFGAALRSYRFAKYRTKERPERMPSLESLTVASSEASGAKRAYRALAHAAEAVSFARDLISEPANVLYP
jgi:leucyl aminopeptidase